MKKVLVLVAILALGSYQAFAVDTQTATVSLEIESYAALTLDPGGFVWTGQAGNAGTSSTITRNWEADANFDAKVVLDNSLLPTATDLVFHQGGDSFPVDFDAGVHATGSLSYYATWTLSTPPDIHAGSVTLSIQAQ